MSQHLSNTNESNKLMFPVSPQQQQQFQHNVNSINLGQLKLALPESIYKLALNIEN